MDSPAASNIAASRLPEIKRLSAPRGRRGHRALRISDEEGVTGSDEKMGLAMEQEIDQRRARGKQTSEAASVVGPRDVWFIRRPRVVQIHGKLQAECSNACR